MKNFSAYLKVSLGLFLLTGLCACDDDKPGPEPGPDVQIAAPTALAVSNITETSAVLTWEGTTTTYEVSVGTQTQTVNAKTFTATGLTAETQYTWKVRATDGTNFSEYATGQPFTTLPKQGGGDDRITEFEIPGANYFYGDQYTPGVAYNFHITLFTKGVEATGNGLMLKIDIFAPMDSRTEIPDGTYALTSDPNKWGEPFTSDPDYTWYARYVNAEELSFTYQSGQAVFSRSGDTYTIVFDYIDTEGEEIKGTYVGPLEYTDDTAPNTPSPYAAGNAVCQKRKVMR